METVPCKNTLRAWLSDGWRQRSRGPVPCSDQATLRSGVLRPQTAGAAAAAAWAEQVPGEPGRSPQPGSALSLLKCAEANTIAPEIGQCDMKTKEKQMNIQN